MNELSTMFLDVHDGDVITLEPKVYHVRQDDCFELTGYYCSNTALSDENPNGYRTTAIYLKAKKGITVDGNGGTHRFHLEFLREAHLANNRFDGPYVVEAFRVGSVQDKNSQIVHY